MHTRLALPKRCPSILVPFIALIQCTRISPTCHIFMPEFDTNLRARNPIRCSEEPAIQHAYRIYHGSASATHTGGAHEPA